ncbi:hypothetical protein O7606_07435 [Micromonospora sp. WMMD882]|uniref:hypothetical protein n=1 Tax=Micromonospora sp. WMMD882 TaxID=3015151 RepID=UPI00248C8ECA|nr:hypothetical protein [Micromonospora sp. WMMD882]WBB81202.1 hypothetical protein O7606_07435 [Micromonospora sp. WMMD882]
MKRIVEIVPARPGWYARWQLAPDDTCCYPVTVWALVEEADGVGREVIGVDCVGQWPGSDDTAAGTEFVRYLFHAPETGQPDDVAPDSELASGASGPSPDAAPRRAASRQPLATP